MENFWDTRYSSEDFVYGQEPNEFYKSEIEKLKPGKILFPGEGDGRNSVFAAKLGFDVTAIDSSSVAKEKAVAYAKSNNLSINYIVSSFDDVNFLENSFDYIVLIFVHLMEDKRTELHRKFISFLKPGGKIILEAFSKDQMNKNSGGPKDFQMLYSKEELLQDFESLSDIQIDEKEIILNEGKHHTGPASVIRLIGTK